MVFVIQLLVKLGGRMPDLGRYVWEFILDIGFSKIYHIHFFRAFFYGGAMCMKVS